MRVLIERLSKTYGDQAQAMALGGSVTYLDPEEARKAEATVAGTVGRPWELWKRKALAK